MPNPDPYEKPYEYFAAGALGMAAHRYGALTGDERLGPMLVLHLSERTPRDAAAILAAETTCVDGSEASVDDLVDGAALCAFEAAPGEAPDDCLPRWTGGMAALLPTRVAVLSLADTADVSLASREAFDASMAAAAAADTPTERAVVLLIDLDVGVAACAALLFRNAGPAGEALLGPWEIVPGIVPGPLVPALTICLAMCNPPTKE